MVFKKRDVFEVQIEHKTTPEAIVQNTRLLFEKRDSQRAITPRDLLNVLQSSELKVHQDMARELKHYAPLMAIPYGLPTGKFFGSSRIKCLVQAVPLCRVGVSAEEAEEVKKAREAKEKRCEIQEIVTMIEKAVDRIAQALVDKGMITQERLDEISKEAKRVAKANS